MPLKKIIDLAFGPALPANVVSNAEYPWIVFNGDYKIIEATIIPTLDVKADSVNYVTAQFINVGKNNDKNDVMVQWTNRIGFEFTKDLDMWKINYFDIIPGKKAGFGDLLKLKFSVGGGGVNFGFPLMLFVLEPL